MSPYLLANTFQVDFYALYKAFNEQKEAKQREKELARLKVRLVKAQGDHELVKKLQ
jgi:hypothetical protein